MRIVPSWVAVTLNVSVKPEGGAWVHGPWDPPLKKVPKSVSVWSWANSSR